MDMKEKSKDDTHLLEEIRVRHNSNAGIEEQFQFLIEASPSGMLIVDDQGHITMANNLTLTLFGYLREELLGQPIEILVPERFRTNHPQKRNAFFAAPEPRAMGSGRDLFGLRKDGSEFPIEIGLNPVQIENHMFVLASIADITARKIAEADIREREERFHKIIEASPSGMIMINQQGKITLANTLTLTLFGYLREELLGQPIEILVPERFRTNHPQKRNAFFAAPEPRAMGSGRDLFGLRKDGSEFPIEIGLNPVRTESGTFVLASVVDISKRKLYEAQLAYHKEVLQQMVDQQTQALIMARDSAEQANAAKSVFLANMSHELRTPMHAILSYTHLAEKKLTSGPIEQTQHFLSEITNSGNRLLLLLNDLLDLSKLQSGKSQMNFRTHDVRDIIHRVASESSPLLHAKKLSFIVEDSTIDTFIECDLQKIYQVFLNLLSNAIKFTPNGKFIRASFKMSRDSLGGQESDMNLEPTLQIAFEDQGIGIPENELNTIFDKFVQSSKTNTGAGGTGLGLAISKEIVEAHRGKIWATNGQDVGAIFTLLLPYTQAITSRALEDHNDTERADNTLTRR
jgi:PAS domain S-box-containing protein